MPTVTTDHFLITLSPSTTEHQETFKGIRERFVSQYGATSKYILSQEKGKSSQFNHSHFYIKFDRPKKTSNFRDQFKKAILPSVEYQNPRVAIDIAPVKKTPEYVIGYVSKEYEYEALNAVYSNFDTEYIRLCHTEYQNNINDKKKALDKYRINKKNLHVMFERYYYLKHKKNPLIKITEDKVKKELAHMIEEGYYAFNLLFDKNIEKLITGLVAYMNKEIYEFINTMIDHNYHPAF